MDLIFLQNVAEFSFLLTTARSWLPEVTKEKTFTKPEGFVPPERKWKEATSKDGKRYYVDEVRPLASTGSVWALPADWQGRNKPMARTIGSKTVH